MDFEELENLFKIRGKDASEFKDSYDQLARRTVESLIVEPNGEYGDLKRIRELSLVQRQVLLHRAINLFSGSLSSLLEINAYSMALSIRGHFETTAALGYLHNRLNSLAEGNLEARVVHHDIGVLFLGTKDKEILKCEEAIRNDMEAKQILDMLQYADKSVSKHILHGAVNEYDILTDCYKHLCEFSHPNFHSNTLAFELKTEEKKYYFKHKRILDDNHFHLIDHLLISNPIFIKLFDKIDGLLPK